MPAVRREWNEGHEGWRLGRCAEGRTFENSGLQVLRRDRTDVSRDGEESMIARYQWAPPKAMEGQWWYFYDHPRNDRDGPLLLGQVMMVQTDYSKGKAYHQYSMQVHGYSRRRIVGEASLYRSS